MSENTSGWVEQLDPISLEPIRRSPDLPSGGHKWCGAICVHENGDLYVVNGTYVHRLNPQLEIVAEHRLAANNAHNGHVVFSDGNLVTKDISEEVEGSKSGLDILHDRTKKRFDKISTTRIEAVSNILIF